MTKGRYAVKPMTRMIAYASIFIAASGPTISFAATSDEKLAACDAALYAKVKEADLCNLGVQLRTDEMARLGTENARLRESNQAWHKNPFVWAAIGVIFGTYAGARAVR